MKFWNVVGAVLVANLIAAGITAGGALALTKLRR